MFFTTNKEFAATRFICIKKVQAMEDNILIPFTVNGQTGLLNRNGEVVVAPEYDIILDECTFDDSIVRVGKLVLADNPSLEDNVASKVQYKYRAVTSDGQFITDMEFDGIFVSPDNQLITVYDREKGYAIFDRDGDEVVPFDTYEGMEGFEPFICGLQMPEL